MKLYILPTLLLIVEMIFFLYIISRDSNQTFRNFAQRMKEKVIAKTGLNLNTEIKNFSRKNYIIFSAIVIITLFMDDKMLIVTFVAIFMVILLKLRMPYDKFEKLFINYEPSLKKYNIYLSVLILMQLVTIILTTLLAG